MSNHVNQHIASLLAQADQLTAEALTLARNAAHALSRAQVARETAADLKVMLEVSAPPAFDYGTAGLAQDDVHYVGLKGEPITKEQNDALIEQSQRDVQHIDAPEEKPAGIPPHVWLYRNMLTELQRLAPLGIDDSNGQYAIAIDQLTEEQMHVPHINKQLVHMRDDMCDHATKVWAENEIVRRC